MANETIIVIREKWVESASRDLTSVACAFVLIGFGVLLDSSAMQWFGFIMTSVVILARAARLRKEMSCTPEEGIKRLQAIIDTRTPHDGG